MYPRCIDVGVFDVRDTPTRMMSALFRSSAPRPSSCLTANSMAAIRRKYWASSGAWRPGLWIACMPDAVVTAFSAGPSTSSATSRCWRDNSAIDSRSPGSTSV